MTSLVPYGSSDDEEEPSDRSRNADSGKREKLPAFIQSDHALHESESKVHTSLGLSSSKPLKGDWLCHVFVLLAQNEEYEKIIEEAVTLLKTYDDSLERVKQPHISLTKPILIRYHEKSVFVPSIEEAIRKHGFQKRPAIAFSTFTCLTSEDTSRVYYTMEVGMGWKELHALTRELNQGLAGIHAREYFKEARYHCSFASSSSHKSDQVIPTRHCEALEATLGRRLRACRPVILNQIHVAIGSQISTIALK